MPYTVAAVDKALELLELLAEYPDSGVTELAKRTNSTKSQVFRLLYTLEQRGFVRKDASSQRYALGYRTLYVGDKTRHQMDLVRVTQPFLDELAELSRENVHLVIREGIRSVCIALSDSPQPLRLYAKIGRRGPLHAGGASKVLLAFAPADIQQEILESELQVFTPTTITDPKQLEQILETIRQTNSYESANDLDDGAFSIAAPIRNHRGDVVAALSIAGPISRLSSEANKLHKQLVQTFSLRISEDLGWQKRLE